MPRRRRRCGFPGAHRSGLVPSAVAGNPITAAVVVALAALLLAGAAAAGRGRRRSSELSRLLEPHVTLRDIAERDQQPTARLESLFAWTERSLSGLPGSERLARVLERSGLALRAGHVPYLAGVAAFVLGVVGTIAGAPPALALLLMLVGLAMPFVVLKVVARRRTQAFDRQLPDVLATIASTLRAGHGLRTALRAIADDGAAPSSEEFGRVLGEERLGRPLDEALAAMCERIGSSDFEYVATAVNVQSQTGGSLAGLFDTLAETVRERQRHARKLKALTGLGRMSAIVLVGLPIGLGLLMTLMSPDYMSPLYSTSSGHVADRHLPDVDGDRQPVPQANRLGEVLGDDRPPRHGNRLPGALRPPADAAAPRRRARPPGRAGERSFHRGRRPPAPHPQSGGRCCSVGSRRCSSAFT